MPILNAALFPETALNQTTASIFGDCNTEGYKQAHLALNHYWVRSITGCDRSKFSMNEAVAVEMLCKALGIFDQGKATNKPFCDLVEPNYRTHEIKCLRVEADPYGKHKQFVITRTVVLGTAKVSAKDAMGQIVSAFNNIVDRLLSDAPQGTFMHHFLYNDAQVIHFVKNLEKMDASKYRARWTESRDFLTLVVADAETGDPIFNYNVHGAKLSMFCKVPQVQNCTIFPLVNIGSYTFAINDNAQELMHASAILANSALAD